MDNSLNASRYNSQSKSPYSQGRFELQASNSALRIKRGGPQGDPRRHTEEDEEDEYERRREEELRRQIKSKEQEIQNLSKASDFLRNKLDHTAAALSQRQQTDPNNSSKYASFGRQLPERDRSPYSQENQQPLPQSSQYMQPPHIREHIANLQSDNASLMRRLNLVLQELERVSSEKEEIQNRLQQFSKESLNLQRAINQEDNLDKVNRYMNEDLIYERDRNQKLKASIREQEHYKGEMLEELRKVEDNHEGHSRQIQQMAQELQLRLNQISDLEKEIYYTQEKIKHFNNAIELGKREELVDNVDKADLQRVVNQLLYERSDLLSKLDGLTLRYDECVREISQDRKEMERHNQQHSKLVTAKIIFQELQQILINKQRQGFEEIRVYCSFDSKCHNKLQAFAKALDQIGRHKMQIGLQKWFQSALKPMESKEQASEIGSKIGGDNLKAKVFYIWWGKYQKRINNYEQKNKAIHLIWKIKLRDAEIEQKRSFQIWAAAFHKQNQQTQTVKKLILQLYYKKLGLAVSAWQNHNKNLDLQIRLSILAQKYTQKQYLNLMFCNFREQIAERKRKRLNMLFHYVKYWKDYLNYRKFLMGANVAAMHFQKSVTTTILKQCFDAMKHSKEEDKFQKVHETLNQVERPLIQDLNTAIHQKLQDRSLQLMKRAGERFILASNKNMNAYFQQWKQVWTNFKEVPNTKIKGRLIKAYNDWIRMAFNRWKVIANTHKIVMSQMEMVEQQETQKNLQEDVLQLSKENKDKVEARDQCGQRRLNKCFDSYVRRLLHIALSRWRDKMVDVNIKEEGASTVIKRMRCRYLRQAFDLYLKGVKLRRKEQIEEQRCAQLRNTRNERMLNLIFNQWRVYKNNHLQAKKSWGRIYSRLDHTLQRRAIRRWREQNKAAHERELQNHQNHVTELIAEKNQEIGQITQVEEGQQQQINSMKDQRVKQAQRVLANRFASFYYTGQTRGFEKWKEFVRYEKHKASLIKKTLDHWKKYQFYCVKSCFQNWMRKMDIQERKDQIKREDLKIKDTDHQFDLQTKTFAALQSKLQSEIAQIQALQNKFNTRMQKSVQMIVKKVDSSHYMSRKRFIWTHWKQYVKREKLFIEQIKNVIQKSLWKDGFQSIKDHSREELKKSIQSQVLNKFRVKFWKRNCMNAFSTWRSGVFKTVFQEIEVTVQATNQKVEEHMEKIVARKDINSTKSGKVINKQNVRNLFQGWRNVAKHLKQFRTKQVLLDQNIRYLQKKWAVQKWNDRKEATQQARMRIKKLREQAKSRRKYLVFREIKAKFHASRDFMERMSNLANIHDHQALKMGYNSIISFAKAKKYVHEKQKQVACQDAYGIFNNLLNMRKIRYWNDLKGRTLLKHKQRKHKMHTVIQKIHIKIRHYFMKWKHQGEHKTLADELHHEGPIREQIFEDRITLKNLQQMMGEEGYSVPEIQGTLQEGKQRHDQMLLKSIRRFQHYNEELYEKPKMFDRWRMFVHMRKLFKYYLRFAGNRTEYVKCDLAVSFDRWRKYDQSKKDILRKLSKEELDQRMLRNADTLGQLADTIQDKENALRHLSDQREELVNNYIKGQRMALALWTNNLKRAKHRALMRWAKNALSLKGEESDDAMRKNVELIAALKDKINQLEKDNDDYSNENEELRQFSLDGYEIAKNVQQLAAEREKLSVDLADKAQTIRKLLDENEKLNKGLRKAQEEAQNLIKSTNTKFMGSQNSSGGVPFQSPMMRNNVY